MTETLRICCNQERAIKQLSANTGKARHAGRRSRSCSLCRFCTQALLLLILVIVLLLTGCSPTRNWQAALLAMDIAAGTEPSRLKKTTAAPSRSEQTFQVDGSQYRGDLYLPADRVQAGLLLVPGAAERGKDDPRLVAFATTLARVGFAVLVPDLPGLRELQVNADDIGQIRDVFGYLLGREELAPGQTAGIGAFSYAAGPAVLAAAEPRMAGKTGFLLSVGGYYSIRDVLIFITTGDYRLDDEWRHMQPNPYGKWVFVKSNLQFLDQPSDRRLFRRMIERKRADLEAPLDDLAGRLTGQGQTLYRFVTNTERARFDRLYTALPEAIRAEAAKLDLAAHDLDRLEAHLILVHGYDDTIIPYTESIALKRALPDGQAELYLVDGLMHVDAEPGLVGKWRMWRALTSLLEQRDRVQSP